MGQAPGGQGRMGPERPQQPGIPPPAPAQPPVDTSLPGAATPGAPKGATQAPVPTYGYTPGQPASSGGGHSVEVPKAAGPNSPPVTPEQWQRYQAAVERDNRMHRPLGTTAGYPAAPGPAQPTVEPQEVQEAEQQAEQPQAPSGPPAGTTDDAGRPHAAGNDSVSPGAQEGCIDFELLD